MENSDVFLNSITNISNNFNANHRNHFDKAIEGIILEMETKIESDNKKLDELQKSLSMGAKNTHKYEPTIDDLYIRDEQLRLDIEIYISTCYLKALYEMKIIYLYRNIEISMKILIKQIEPKNRKKCTKWKDIISFFLKSKNIKIYNLEGYRELNDLRIINNFIKHEGEMLTIKEKKIEEFKDEDELNCLSMKTFYTRVKPKFELFYEELFKACTSEMNKPKKIITRKKIEKMC
jgi:hypothetical protein